MAASRDHPESAAPNFHDWTFPGARAVVAIVHGYAEHGARYAHVAAALRDHGMAAIALDLRGHGRSPGRRGHVRRFADYGADVVQLLDRAGEFAAAHGPAGQPLPVFLLGHSMGGLVILDLLTAADRARPELAGVVLSSPLLGLGRRITIAERLAARVLDVIWPSCPLPSGLDPSAVCRDPELQARYGADELVFRTTTPRWFREATRAMARVHAATLPQGLPVLLMFASVDKVVDADATRRFAAAHAVGDVVAFDDTYHELFNDLPERRDAVIDCVTRWLDRRIPTPTDRAPG